MIVRLISFRRNVKSLVGDQIYERFGLAFLPSVGTRYQLVLLLVGPRRV